jgi:hypothetical protein
MRGVSSTAAGTGLVAVEQTVAGVERRLEEDFKLA